MEVEIALKLKAVLWRLDLVGFTLNVIKLFFVKLSINIAAAQALLDIEGLDAEQIARKAMNIAADLCVYTNHDHVVEVLESKIKDDLK